MPRPCVLARPGPARPGRRAARWPARPVPRPCGGPARAVGGSQSTASTTTARVRAGPRSSSRGGFAVGRDQPHAGRPVSLERGDDRRPDAVVAAVRVADADHDRAPARSPALDRQVEEVRRAGDARVVVADRRSHCAVSASSSRSRRAGTTRRRSSSIAAWFCDVGGTIVGRRRSGRRRRARSGGTAGPRGASLTPCPTPARGGTSTNGRLRRLVRLDHAAAPRRPRRQSRPRAPRCCGTGCGRPAQPGAAAACLRGQRRQPLRGQRVPGQRPGEVPAAGQRGVQRGRVRDLLLDDVLAEVAAPNASPPAVATLAALDRVPVRVVHGQQLVVVVEVGEVEPGHPVHRGQRVVERAAAAARPARAARPGRRPVEAADAHVDRVDGPAADQLQDRVAGLLQRQPPLHDGAVVAGHLDAPG